MKTLLILPLLAATACAADAPSATPVAPVPSALVAAHAAYLAGDFLKMTRSLRTVLAADAPAGAVDPDVRDNALALLESAYAHAGGSLPADWSLPAGLDRLELGQARVEETNVVRFGVSLSAHVDAPERLVGLQLTRGGEAILDLAAGRGKLKVEREEDERYYVSLEGDEGVSPIGPGVYDVRIELRGAPAVTGWILAGDMTAAAAPRIRAPIAGARVDANPTLSFEDFRSPGYSEFEERVLWIGVSRARAFEWTLWAKSPSFTDVVVGEDPRGEPATTLPSGRHWVAVQFSEKRTFGPVRIARSSRSQQPFDVR